MATIGIPAALTGRVPVFTPSHQAVRFPLSGIAAGGVAVTARGNLTDWELFNRPEKGLDLPYTGLWVRVAEPGGRVVFQRLMEGPLQRPYGGSHGIVSERLGGIPRFPASALACGMPQCWLTLEDPDVPLRCGVDFASPFVPGDLASSAVPLLEAVSWLRNDGEQELEVSLVLTLCNPVGYLQVDNFGALQQAGTPRNTLVEPGSAQRAPTILMDNPGLPPQHPTTGTVALRGFDLTGDQVAASASWQPQFLDGGWFDGIQEFWSDLYADGALEPAPTSAAHGNDIYGQHARPAALCFRRRIAPGASFAVRWTIAWYLPFRTSGWGNQTVAAPSAALERVGYAARWTDALHVLRWYEGNRKRIAAAARDFQHALFGSTLPPALSRRLAASLVPLRSSTVFASASGRYYGWEGTFDRGGSCPGTCSHVWNYAQSAAYLFPEIERDMRLMQFVTDTDEHGFQPFRTRGEWQLPWIDDKWRDKPAAVDGVLGSVIRALREWRLSGDREFLARVLPGVERVIDFARRTWDRDDDRLLEGEQHTTYDIELTGVNPISGLLFVTALRSYAQLLEADQPEATRATSDDLRREADISLARLVERAGRNGYFIQAIDDIDERKYQWGHGVLSDQLLGEFLALQAGLPPALAPERLQTCLRAILATNWGEVREGHVQRTFAVPGERGLRLCGWLKPQDRPRFPFPYSDEVWTGVEYTVAALCIAAGMVDEGLRVVAATDTRHDGVARDPYNEVECGNHYARSMAAWGVLNALLGIQVRLDSGEIHFAPVPLADRSRLPFVAGAVWGVLHLDSTTDVKQNRVQLLGAEGEDVRFYLHGRQLTVGR